MLASTANRNTFEVSKPSPCEVRMTRLFNAPRALVYEVMTKPEHVKRWWGQLGEGYSVPVCEIDLRVGGKWKFVNRHPQGEVTFYGDDIAWIWVDENGVLRGFNPENGVFGVAKDTNEKTNPGAVQAILPGSGAIFTNVAYNEKTQEVWWEGKTPEPPTELDGWLDWKGERIADRTPEQADEPWAHPNSRFTTTLSNIPNIAPD